MKKSEGVQWCGQVNLDLRIQASLEAYHRTEGPSETLGG